MGDVVRPGRKAVGNCRRRLRCRSHHEQGDEKQDADAGAHERGCEIDLWQNPRKCPPRLTRRSLGGSLVATIQADDGTILGT